jgi:probable rRNA maturation factor
MTNLIISKECKCRIPRHKMSLIAQHAVDLGDISTASQFQVLITDDDKMRVLNRKYRGYDEITDILTFPADIPDPSFLGDIIIDIQQADRQKGSHSLENELIILLIHGILHLIGYDHIRKEDRNRMLIKENEYRSFMKEN